MSHQKHEWNYLVSGSTMNCGERKLRGENNSITSTIQQPLNFERRRGASTVLSKSMNQDKLAFGFLTCCLQLSKFLGRNAETFQFPWGKLVVPVKVEVIRDKHFTLMVAIDQIRKPIPSMTNCNLLCILSFKLPAIYHNKNNLNFVETCAQTLENFEIYTPLPPRVPLKMPSKGGSGGWWKIKLFKSIYI